MTYSLKTLMATLALTWAAGSVLAQGRSAPTPAPTPRIDHIQAHQAQRIQQGLASGQLTPHEARRLGHQQARIAAFKARAESDGVVTAGERHRLAKMQRHASRSIWRHKHDGRHVGSALGGLRR